MGIQCEVLKVNKYLLASKVKTFLRNINNELSVEKAVEIFLKGFQKGPTDTTTRLEKKSEDNISDIEKVTRQFKDDFETIIVDFQRNEKTKKFISQLETLKHETYKRFFNETDFSQKGNPGNEDTDQDNEIKTMIESQDVNRAKLDEHLKEFYGAGSYNIINNLKDTFRDNIVSVAYWDSTTGEIVVNSKPILNQRIYAYKDKLYGSMIRYMKAQGLVNNDTSESMFEDGKFIGLKYVVNIEKFYRYFKSLKNAQDRLVDDNRKRISREVQKDKEARYAAIYKALEEVKDEVLKTRITTRINNKFTNNAQRQSAKIQLYRGDGYSEYYQTLKSMIKSFNLGDIKIKYSIDGKVKTQTINDAIAFIESEQDTLLSAANAYTSLVHFDKMLKDSITSITFDKRDEGSEVGDMEKYDYHQDTAHEKKGWQTSESIDSEKYTSNLTKAVFSQIRIYDYKTNQYTNKRVDSTSFIVAARNLIDDIIYNRVNFSAKAGVNSANLKEAAKEFMELLTDFHSNPSRNFQRILELLFDNGTLSIINNMSPNEGVFTLLTENDKNILYSIYNSIFSKKNPASLLNAELGDLKDSNVAATSLVGEIAGYVDRNASLHYTETAIDYATGEVIIRVKRKFSNSIGLKKTIDEINNLANLRSDEETKRFQKNYNFSYSRNSLDAPTYTITIGTDSYQVAIHKKDNTNIKLFAGKAVYVPASTKELLRKFDKIDLIEYRRHVISGTDLSDVEEKFTNFLEFLEDALGIKFTVNPDFTLQALQIFKETYRPSDDDGFIGVPTEGYSAYLEPLFMLAMRSSYVTKRRGEALDAGKSLKEYLDNLKDDDGVYEAYLNNKKTNKIITEKFNQIKYRVAGWNSDKVLSKWEDAKAMLTGQASKATTKDKKGNSIPNNSVNKLGNMLNYYLNKQRKSSNTNTDSLLFVNNPQLIKGVYHDLEVTAQNNESKSLREFSSGELFFHAIFNKFWGNYLTRGSVIVQPTTYSDKTTFLNWDVDPRLRNLSSNEGWEDVLGTSMDNPSLYQNRIIRAYGDTIGKMYSNVWNSTKEKLRTITNYYNDQKKTTYSFKELLNILSSEELIHWAQEASKAYNKNLDLELDKDYRRIEKEFIDPKTGIKTKKKVCAHNELLEYYAEKLYAPNKKGIYSELTDFLNQQKKVFIAELIRSNSSFQVIDFNDSIDNYIEEDSEGGKSKNAIISTINRYFDKDTENGDKRKRKFFNEWVDAETGKLILAKTKDGKNILGIGDNYNNEDVILNPFLDKFFYMEGLISNNLRMSLTGSEINHPDKAKKSTYNLFKKLDFENAENGAQNIDIVKNLLGLSELSSTDAVAVQKFLKDNTTVVSDIFTQKIQDLAKAEGIDKIVNKIYNRTLIDIANVAQGTQFKRNVIIPATLQYCRQGEITGVPAKIKCAVIMDEGAPVYNYRGDKEKSIDAADGSAQINPFQSILENKSLDSQAVGFTKKPIWHAYDAESGTAFLAKFATDTITNEAMKASLDADSSLYRLFKKMTNLQWQGDVDLTRTITNGKNPRKEEVYGWFRQKALGNAVVQYGEVFETLNHNRLFYRNSYGDVKEIIELQKEGDIYYTSEKDYYVPSPGKPIPKYNNSGITKVYHIFYNGSEGKSLHKTFNTRQAAEKFRDEVNSGTNPNMTNAHTINSLFELHSALGGIDCVNARGESSEFNNEVVVNYMNEVGHLREDGPTVKQKDQASYIQPLKNYHIGYALNNTAVKNGAKNVNESKCWHDDTELVTFDVDSDGLGMQMNADHDIIDSELTEFSQVITATSAYGYTFDNSNEIFTSLGMAAFQASEKALRATENFIKSSFTKEGQQQALSDLYDAVGRIIMTNSSIKDKESLQHIIMGAVQNVFFNSRNHLKDDVIIPLSDANIYSDFIATVASTVNKESIKRKHPGSGCVIVPGYNTMMYYEVDGQKMMPDDLIEKAREDYKNEVLESLKSAASISPQNNENVDLLFARVPELATIGSKEDYLRYLSTIYPNSVDKGIYWHGTNADFSKDFESAKKNEGSGAPETKERDDFYLNKQAWASLQYINGVNRKGKDNNGFAHWNKLYWELKEIMSNGRRDNSSWKDLVIGPDNVRKNIPNKYGLFNKDKGGKNGTYLRERKKNYGYATKTDEEFFKEVFGIDWGKDTFNTWVARNAEIFKGLQNTTKGLYAVVINTSKPIRESGKDTYYEEHRGLMTQAENNGNDAILSTNSDNEFNSDVAVLLNIGKDPVARAQRVHFLGTEDDIEGFKKFLASSQKGTTVSYEETDKGLKKLIITKDGTPNVNYLNSLSLSQLIALRNQLKISGTNYDIDSEDTQHRNISMLRTYLQKRQADAPIFENVEWFMPSDVVNILDKNGKPLRIGINLDSMDRYYKFKDGLDAIEIATGAKIKADYQKGLITITTKDRIELEPIKVSDTYVEEIMELLGLSEMPLYKYQVNVTKAHNLRPSLIRWQYRDKDSKVHYRNIFDTDIIRISYVNPSQRGEDYRTKIQNILHDLHEGRDDRGREIIEGSLENTAAELIMSNIYKDKFGIDNESLNNILQQGEAYFKNEKRNYFNPPSDDNYDIAFLSDTGNATLISLSPVRTGDYRQLDDFGTDQLMTNEKDEIMLMKGNRELFEVGRWVNVEKGDGIKEKDGKFFMGNQELDATNFRYKTSVDTNGQPILQKRIMYVKRYKVFNYLNKDKTKIVAHTLYQLSDINEFKKAMKNLPDYKEEDAYNQRASIIQKMYGNNKAVYINGGKTWLQRKEGLSDLDIVYKALSRIRSNDYTSKDAIDLIDAQYEELAKTVKTPFGKETSKEDKKKAYNQAKEVKKVNKKSWLQLKDEFLAKEAHRKWISFQDSLNFIAARIPAQTLQSFMSMKLVAWTKNSKNMAYVSHFQTYLQGSDYDIDKAYIMGQSYDNQATYIGWSKLFDYSTYETLQASKQLPVPKGRQWDDDAKALGIEKHNMVNGKKVKTQEWLNATQVRVEKGFTDSEVAKYLNIAPDGKLESITDDNLRAKAIKLLADVIRKAEQNNRILYYDGDNHAAIANMIILINNHEHTPLHPSITEAAYKNVASANIYSVAHDIRNRDQAYTAITMKDMQDAADNSPKGNQAGNLNMLNPLTKYIMQYQNLVGKNVISVAANGEKVWFNTYYYWTKVLQSEDSEAIKRLKFQQTFNRIAGRAKNNPISKTVSSLPDMNFRDQRIKRALIKEFGIAEKDMGYAYVDQLISQLLSAATDNAKELILAKINSGTNFARNYVYAIMTGYNIDDIVAFMTSPVAEFIDQMSAANIFQDENAFNRADTAISLAEGYINTKKFLHGTITDFDEDEYGDRHQKQIRKDLYILNYKGNISQDIYDRMKEYAELDEEQDFKSLNSLMKAFINVAVQDSSIKLSDQINVDTEDTEINSYLAYCQNIIDQLRKVYKNKKYHNKEEVQEDIKEFKKLYDLATEVSTIATAYLSLNQGLPTDELGIIKKLISMSKLVSSRERILGIRCNQMYESAKVSEIDEDEDWETVSSQGTSGGSEENRMKAKNDVITKILENNPTLGTVEEIEARLDAAYTAGIMNNFDINKYLVDKAYREKVKDYYGLLAGTINIFDMLDNLPTYQANLDCLTFLVVSNKLADKSRFIQKMAAKKTNVSDKELQGLIEYSDQLRTFNFIKELPIINVGQEITGFNDYFDTEKTSTINLSQLNGMATFRRWVENEFFDYLQNDPVFSKNGAVKHLQKIMSGDQMNIAMDIDVLQPNINAQSELAYDEILRGMVELDNSKSLYKDSGLTVADILQLYNILVNNNKYGSERLTTTFKVCKNPDNILNKYLKWTGKHDFNEEAIFNEGVYDYDLIDYKIASAPLITEFQERNHNEDYVKVRDDVQGYILKKLDKVNNLYVPKSLIPSSPEIETPEQGMQRIENFATYVPMLFINSHEKGVRTQALIFENMFNVTNADELSEKQKQIAKDRIIDILKQNSIANMLRIFKECA